MSARHAITQEGKSTSDSTIVPADAAEFADAALLVVVDDFPSGRCIAEAELVVIETYLADILDEILGGEGAPLASLRHTRSA
jgi:hypothetical protein